MYGKVEEDLQKIEFKQSEIELNVGLDVSLRSSNMEPVSVEKVCEQEEAEEQVLSEETPSEESMGKQIESLNEKSNKLLRKKEKLKKMNEQLKNELAMTVDELNAHKELVSELTNKNFKLQRLALVSSLVTELEQNLAYEEDVSEIYI